MDDSCGPRSLHGYNSTMTNLFTITLNSLSSASIHQVPMTVGGPSFLLVYCIAMTTKCNDIIILPTTPDLQSSASVQYI